MAKEDPPEVETKAGLVRGFWRPTRGKGGSSRSAAFLGIPFAEAPVGDLRFKAPVPKKPWKGVKDTLSYGPTAQRGDPGETLIPEPSIPGDSTLNVNVFTPSPKKAAPGEGLPVLVWFHGGGYFAGSPASPWYDGRNFNRDGIVTVTTSYRLGFDGFGWIDSTVQNRGVLDWIAALQWVQDNIGAFGGDPDRVTIAGQSAGGGAVLTLLGCPAAQSLFHGVYALSAPTPDISAKRAKKFAHEMAGKLGVASTLEGFASVSENAVLKAQKTLTEMQPEDPKEALEEGMRLAPVVDGDLIPLSTLESIRSGVGSDKHLVLGATDDEFAMATADQKLLRWIPKRILLEKAGIPKEDTKAYLAANEDVAKLGGPRLLGRVITDQVFKVPMLLTVDARGEAPTWVYRFSWRSGAYGFALHCVDVPFFFDCLDGPSVDSLAGEKPPQELADQIHHAAVEFVRTGDPGWPRYPIVRVWDQQIEDIPSAFASAYPLLPQ